MRDNIDMGLARRVANAQHLVVVEVALLDSAVLERDFVQEANAEPHDDRAFKLRADAVRIHDRAAVNRNVDPRDRDVALFIDRSFDDGCDIAHKAAMDSETQAMTLGHVTLAPTGLLRDELDDVAQPAGVDRVDLWI